MSNLSGDFLDRTARSFGLSRNPGETDGELRTRIMDAVQNPDQSQGLVVDMREQDVRFISGNGEEVLRIDGNGQALFVEDDGLVGIGTSAPSVLLNISQPSDPIGRAVGPPDAEGNIQVALNNGDNVVIKAADPEKEPKEKPKKRIVKFDRFKAIRKRNL